MHHGASPEQLERIVEKAKASGDVGGVTGNNVFVVVGENVTFIPFAELKGRPKESRIAVVGDAVVQDLTGNKDIIYDQVAAVNEVADETGLSVEEILNDGDIAGLDPEIIQEIKGAMDAITQFESHDACVAGGGGDVCDQVQSAMYEYDT